MTARTMLLFICLAGVAARAGIILSLPAEPQTEDERDYLSIARHIRENREFSVHPGVPTAYRAPGYPALLAGLQTVLSDVTQPLRLAQALLGMLLCPLAFLLARRLWDDAAGLVAAGLCAFHPYLVFLASQFVVEVVFAPLLLVSFLLLLAVDDDRAAWPQAAAAGVAAGLTNLVRATYVPFAALGAFWILQKRGPKPAAAYALCVGLVMIPWFYRNAVVMGAFIPVSTEGGQALWHGNNPRATGGGETYGDPDLTRQHSSEVDLDRAYWQAGRRNILSDPHRFLQMAVKKAWLFWRPFPHQSGITSRARQLAAACTWALIVPAALFTIIQRWRTSSGTRLLGGFLLYMTLFHMVFVGQIRFRIPVEPLLIVLAAPVLVGALRKASSA